ncbi:MAG: helix-turn-helix domain-containing protein, partial [Pseudohongiella sp.]|nr:helix-turn-helix domain-containing protein [Pseudohongiella sp.]
GLDPAPLPPASAAAHALTVAGLAVRRLRIREARAALADAEHAARQAGIGALLEEVKSASLALDAPAARLITRGEERTLLLEDVETLFATSTLVVDACSYAVRQSGSAVALTSRPVLFALVRALAEAWPADVPRDTLVARAFRGKEADESYRARLRVEMGRLRALLLPLARVNATARGFELAPLQAAGVAVLAPPIEGPHGEVLACLADGESWSSSDLALALGASQRTVQRALEALALAGKVLWIGQGRSRRWTAVPVVAGFTTILLLPASLPAG